ncbi:MAG TPA: ABC transporter family substrate-binding protein, partial [Pseudonocardiaceae bacterium]|nr:ABC transporter family substrate-binding protein [Pseudonocardiaceae bacterium]
MGRRRYGVGALIGVAVTVTLVLSGCGSTNSGNQLQNSNQLAHKTEDINPRDPSTLVDGNFVWPLDQWEPNWNFNEVDGGDEGEPDVFDAYLPRFFLIQPDSSAVINHDYLTSATVTDNGQQVVTYNINPKAKWSNGDPLIWSDLKTQWLALNGSNPAFEV